MFKKLHNLRQLLFIQSRKQLKSLVFMMVMVSFLELFALSALLPIIKLLQHPDLVSTSNFFSSVYQFLGSPSQGKFFSFFIILLLFLFVIKNVSTFFMTNFQYKIISQEFKSLSLKLLKSYLYSPYTFRLQSKTFELVQNVTTETEKILQQVLLPITILVSETFVILAIFLLIAFVNPFAAITSVCFGGLMIYAYSYFTKNKSTSIAKELHTDFLKMMQYAKEGLEGVKEVKILNCEQFFLNGFSEYVTKYAEGIKRTKVINSLPRSILETMFVGIFACIFLVLSFLGKTDDILPFIAIYAASVFRLIPNLNKIMSAINHLKQGMPSLELVRNALNESILITSDKESTFGQFQFEREIRVVDISFQYHSKNDTTLRNIRLKISKGEMIGFMGKSGVGKSTLIDIIIGLLKPQAGKILVDNNDIQLNLTAWQKQIGYVPQNIFLIDSSIRSNIGLGLHVTEIEDEKIWKALKEAQLYEYVKSLPDGLDTQVGGDGIRISGGQRQRIGIARALYYNPSLLVFDEATSSLDNEASKSIMREICSLRRQKTILFVSHHLSVLSFCDRVYCIENQMLIERMNFKGKMQYI